MYLHKLLLNLQCKEARRDISDPYEMHSTLCRAFSLPETKCPECAFLWRLEPKSEMDGGLVKVLVQSKEIPNWEHIQPEEWFAEKPAPPIHLISKLSFDEELKSKMFRFRLRANPSICRAGKRHGLFSKEDQVKWVSRQAEKGGFLIHSVQISADEMIFGRKRKGLPIKMYTVLFDGMLSVIDPVTFLKTFQCGIGHGKSMGLGLLSVIPILNLPVAVPFSSNRYKNVSAVRTQIDK